MNDKVQTAKALILFAHGARDPRWAEPLTRIRQLVADKIDKEMAVHQAFLELMSPSLPELVAQLNDRQIELVRVVPIFLGQGAHVRSDLPKLIQELEIHYPHMCFELAPAIGENEHVLEAIADVCIKDI